MYLTAFRSENQNTQDSMEPFFKLSKLVQSGHHKSPIKFALNPQLTHVSTFLFAEHILHWHAL